MSELDKYMEENPLWQDLLRVAVKAYIDQTAGVMDKVHTAETPNRVVGAFAEYVSGYLEDPGVLLKKSFEDSSGCDEMVQLLDIPVVSMCAHHLAPIIGQAHFAYIPHNRVVGLSKIPRFIDVLARRLQIQERLCHEIVEVFTKATGVSCAVEIVAYHCCMLTRGVRAHPIITHTAALRGAFKEQPATRAEFFARAQEMNLL